MKKIFLLFLLVFVFSINNVSALNIVSFGDSISYGYLLKNTDNSYDNMVAEKIDAHFFEYSVVGMTSYELYDNLKSGAYDDEIKNADIIFISTGANDYLDLLFEIELNGVRLDTSVDKYLDFSPDFNINNFLDSLKESITSEEFNNKAENVTNGVKEHFKNSISYIKSINSDAKIYVLNLYNPYFNLSNPMFDVDYISNIFEKHLSNINEYIEDTNGDYIVIDAHKILKNYKLINVDILSLNLDPHPNKYGHQALYDAFMKELTYKVEVYDSNGESTIYYVLKGEKLNVDKPTKKGYKFVKWDKDLDNISSNLTVRPVFKKDYTKLTFVIGVLIVLISTLIIKKRKRA